jgi:hypothetical protein
MLICHTCCSWLDVNLLNGHMDFRTNHLSLKLTLELTWQTTLPPTKETSH